MIKRIASIISAATCAGLIVISILPLSTVEKAFATARGVSTDNVASQAWVQHSCKDFEFWFLNASCSQVHAKHAARTKRRIASYATGSLADARMASPGP